MPGLLAGFETPPTQALLGNLFQMHRIAISNSILFLWFVQLPFIAINSVVSCLRLADHIPSANQSAECQP
jgi:hypothetical protein